MIIAALKETAITQAEAASRIGWTPQRLSARLTRNTMRADDFIELMDAIGVDITLTVHDTGALIKPHIQGAGRRIRAMVNKVIYDTNYADALSNNFYANGVDQYVDGRAIELYIDREGRYFFAEYTNLDGVKDRITPISAGDAATFIERYGTELFRKPIETEDE